ncbi:sodium/hydrogen exchanger 9B2-like isoform X2 [Hetaerina americana]
MNLAVSKSTEEPARQATAHDTSNRPNAESLQGSSFRNSTFRKCLFPSSSTCPESEWRIKAQHAILLIILPLLIWGIFYAAIGEDAAPGGNVFAMGLLFGAAAFAGPIAALARLPPLLGMLLMGIFLRNIGFFNITGGFIQLVGVLRRMAMVVILTKGGLGLDGSALRRLSFVVLRLALFPCLSEAATICIASHFLLGFPWLWGALMGFILGAVSPAVVVPSLLNLKEKGYGEDKGISTLVIAASSIDDIVAISAFGVVLGIIFSEGSITEKVLQGPLEVLIGLTFGIVWGFLSAAAVPKGESNTVMYRSMLVGGGGLFAVFGSQAVGYDGAGPLACITSAFVSSCCWKRYEGMEAANSITNTFSVLWLIFQPILFGLIGTEVNFAELQSETLIRGFGVLFIGLTVRVCVCLLVTQGGILSMKEILFVAIAWFPKATVQAAFGPVALDISRKKTMEASALLVTNSTLVDDGGAVDMNDGEDILGLASKILTIAVLSILMTAPLGAVGIALSGPRLLTKSSGAVPVESTSQGKSSYRVSIQERETNESVP